MSDKIPLWLPHVRNVALGLGLTCLLLWLGDVCYEAMREEEAAGLQASPRSDPSALTGVAPAGVLIPIWFLAALCSAVPISVAVYRLRNPQPAPAGDLPQPAADAPGPATGDPQPPLAEESAPPWPCSHTEKQA